MSEHILRTVLSYVLMVEGGCVLGISLMGRIAYRSHHEMRSRFNHGLWIAAGTLALAAVYAWRFS